ncbi:hypothetical protein KDN24_19190 [Bacillus sp. Bva_UNVM-123]|uniref:hypothetical protein n=1 Tax=Bacillus sp. Bva_UNVM-123 TaxID=2829798 RepID=UPI00391F131C
MTEKSSFFDSTPTDSRKYSADAFAEYFRTLFMSGVFLDKDVNALKVTAAGTAMETTLNIGIAYLEGYRYENDAPLHLLHAAADQAQERKDRIIIRLDKDLRTINAYVKQGVAGSVAPTLERTAKIYEICVATVTVVAGKSYIESSQIVDERLNQELCGLASPTHIKQHAHDHRRGGPDEITPEMIGALPITGGDLTGPLTINGKPVGSNEIDGEPADITYYVRANGNDNNDGRTEATAFKTFGKAMTKWKRFTLGGKRTFNIGPDVDLAADLTPVHREWKVQYKWGGEIVFDFNNAHSLVPQFYYVKSKVRIQNFTRFNSGIFDGSMMIGENCYFQDCLHVDVDNVKIDFSKGSPEGYSPNGWAFAFEGTRGRVGLAELTKVSNFLYASEFAYVFVYQPKGTVNDSYSVPFIASNGAIIYCLLYQITGATTKYETREGGQVYGIN